jgi:hypothetical protein
MPGIKQIDRVSNEVYKEVGRGKLTLQVQHWQLRFVGQYSEHIMKEMEFCKHFQLARTAQITKVIKILPKIIKKMRKGT